MPSDKASQLNELERGEVGCAGVWMSVGKGARGGHSRLEVLRRSWRVVKAGQCHTDSFFFFMEISQKKKSDLHF